MIIPSSLEQGDTIAILSPASVVKPEYIAGAAGYLRQRGFNVRIMPSAEGPSDGSYAASLDRRLDDFRSALLDKEVKAILCARGGYGCIHLLPSLDPETAARNPKWVIGFSDVSALHAYMLGAGVASVHGPMARHLATEGAFDPWSDALVGLLTHGGKYDYAVSGSPYNRPGTARGMLRGGNLAVLNSLAGTPYDILKVEEDEEVILFLEDIGEKIYAVERMLSRLCMSGAIYRLKGLVFGHFNGYEADRNFGSMEEMIDRLLCRCGVRDLPVAFGFPVGHEKENASLTEGLRAELTVTSEFTRLRSL